MIPPNWCPTFKFFFGILTRDLVVVSPLIHFHHFLYQALRKMVGSAAKTIILITGGIHCPVLHASFKQRLTPTQQTAVSVLNSPPNSPPAALTMCSWGHALCKKAAQRFTHCNHRATRAQSNLSIWTSQTIAHSPLHLLPCRRAMGGWTCLLTMRRSAVVLGV